MAPRHDQHVHRRLRVDVLEGDDAIVLVDDGAGISPATILQNRQSATLTSVRATRDITRDPWQVPRDRAISIAPACAPARIARSAGAWPEAEFNNEPPAGRKPASRRVSQQRRSTRRARRSSANSARAGSKRDDFRLAARARRRARRRAGSTRSGRPDRRPRRAGRRATSWTRPDTPCRAALRARDRERRRARSRSR